MGRRIGKPQTPTKAGYSDVFDTRQHQKYVKDNILANPKDDALGGVRFDTTDYLTRTSSTAGNRKTFTISVWAKRSALDASNVIYGPRSGSEFTLFYFSNQKINLYTSTSGSEYQITTEANFRDLNSWYHVVVSVDTTQALQSDRGKIYINGVEQSLATNNYPQDLNTKINGTLNGDIGRQATGINYYDGYLSNLYIVDGLALDPTYFGYTDRETGQWKPKRYTGDFGMNGFHLPMSGDFKAGYVRANIGDYDNTNLENNKADIYSVSAATFTSVWKAHEGKWGKSSWGNNHGKIELTADDAYNVKDVSATPFTIEAWVKYVEEDGSYPTLMSFGTSDYNAWSMWYAGNTNKFHVTGDTSGGAPWDVDHGIVLDPYDGEWHHVAYTRNTSGQYKLHYDGEYKGILTTNTNDLITNNNTVKIFSHYSDSTQATSDYQNPFIYYDSIRMIKGQDLYGTSDITGWSADIWNIASTKETYVGSGTDLTGTVSFLLPPNRYDAPFKEISGRNNNFRIEGHNSYDGVKDSPQNTFATLDRLAGTSGVFTNGNLKYQATQDIASSTLGASSGLSYFEVYIDTSNNNYIGILDISQGQNPLRGGSNWNQHGALAYKADGTQYILQIGGTSSVSSYGGTMSSGDIIGVAFDLDKDTLTFYKNGISQGNTTYGPSYINHDGIFGALVYGGTSSSSGAIFNVNFGQDHTFLGNKTALAKPYTDANGIGEFYYPPPDGAFALCTKNLEGGLGNATTTKKYYNRDETGKVLSYEGYNDYTYGTINDERFSDLSPYSGTSTKSVFFDGTNDIIRFQDDTKTSLIFLHDGSPYTVEFAIQVLTTPPSTRNHIIGTTQPSSTNIGLGIYLSDDLTFRIYTVSGISGASQYIDSTSSLNLGVWHNVALTYDGNSGNGGTNTFALYIDGTDVASSLTYQNGSSFNHSSSNANRMLTFASDNNDTNFWHGRLTNVRISNVVRSGLTSVPTENLSSDSNTKILFQPYNTETVNNTTPMYPRDEVGKVLDYNGSVSFVNVSPYADNSVKSFDFDGTDGCYITVKDTSTIDFGTSDFTIEMWVLINTLVTDNYFINWSSTGGNNTHSGINLYAGAWRVGAFDDYLLTGTLTTGVSANEWKHLAMVRYSNTLYFYVDGVSIGTPETVTGVNFSSDDSEGFRLASYINDATKNPNCFMSDVRIVKGTAVYTGAFTPPSGKLTTTGGTYPSTTNVNTSITAGHTTFLAQPYSQPAQIHDVGSTYRTNQIYLTDETGNNLTYV